ncbi:HAD-IA family hydrolase [Nakamurella endophytica]|uniref:Haloacid dehalogenase n=1 Tax=Nakamurella endophytica TaxID=1748367 RepID=A0A917SVU0_9ACTN|nr:HAD-IA family hydrolase [Nakamurella endophytica]GGL97903.1 haloacid dehalogenase [Nakamurella endophytica]
MTTLTVDAVLFDLDGTLVDSTASVHRNWAVIARLLGRPGEDLIGDLHGIPARQVLRMRAPDLSEDRLDELHRVVSEGEVAEAGSVVPTPGAAELLAGLPADRWAVVTSGGRRLAAARMAGSGLPAPVAMVTADDVTTGKPDPEPFLLGAAALHRDPSRCLVVEDAPAGVAAARAAGCPVLGLRTTYPSLDADTVADLTAVRIDPQDGGLLVRY